MTQAKLETSCFESMENADFCTAGSLYQELKKRISSTQGKMYLFLDEIQAVEQWEKCINSVRVDFDCDIYITGSNAKLLSGELVTYLGGRYVEFVVFPFSYEEYLESIKQENDEFSVTEEFKNYLEMGGMPFLVNLHYDKDGFLAMLPLRLRPLKYVFSRTF